MPRQEVAKGELRREREMLHELKKFHRENEHLASPLATQFTKKRIRVPQIQPETNPFCMERQLADEYALLNLNKNPRFYAPSVRTSPRLEENLHNHSSFINQSADLMASSNFSPRARAEFAACAPPTSYRPAKHFGSPKIVHIDASEMRTALPSKNGDGPSASPNVVHSPRFFPPSHAHYSVTLTKQTVTFGHRPESASRMYDPLSSTVVIKPSVKSARHQQQQPPSTSVKTGMSVMQLQELLTPSKRQQRTQSVGSSSPSTLGSTASSSSTVSSSGSPRRVLPVHERLRAIEREMEQQETKRKALEELENGYTGATLKPPRERRAVRFLPPTDQTTAQLIDKYRKLAAGKLPGES